MKILFIFTGGTIGSTLNGNYVCTDSEKPRLLLSTYDKKYKIDFEYSVLSPYLMLSENNTGNQLKQLYSCVKHSLNEGYDGIIITHGTDTLQYSASAISYAVGNESIPIVFVSSNYPLENPLSNGLENLSGGIEFIKQGLGKGVFISYKNDKKIVIHRASRLIFSNPLQDDVNSLKNNYYGEFDSNLVFIKSPLYVEKPDEIAPLNLDNLSEFSKDILWLNHYVGMPYPKLGGSVKYVLINAYHSGTINTSSCEAINFFNSAKQLKIKVFICGITRGVSYQSTNSFNSLNVIPIYDISPISAYIKLWILSSTNSDLTLLNSSLSADVVE